MNKSALITGGSRGIGRSIAYHLAERGYDIHVTCKKSFELLEQLKKELEHDFHISCCIYKCDMANYDDVATLFSSITNLDVVINNVGISYFGLLHEMSREQWNEVINTNLSSAFYTSKLSIPIMLQQQSGKIINISSVWGSVGASTEVAYSASKGGLHSFTKALAKELAPGNIQVNAIACGLIQTSMNDCLSTEDLEQLINEIPANRIGQANEVAKMVIQLLDSPSYLTGQIIHLDGGWL